MCTWLAIGWWRDGKPSLVGALTGAVAGLATVTPCAGYVPTWAAFIIGLSAGSLCYFAVVFVRKVKWDDALDVWAAHGVGGTLGIILLGVFATYTVNPTGGQGLITGHWHFFGWQVTTAVVVAAYAFVATYLILKLINLFDPIRVPDSVELKGLDDCGVRRGGLRPDLRAAPARAAWPYGRRRSCRPSHRCAVRTNRSGGRGESLQGFRPAPLFCSQNVLRERATPRHMAG